MSSEADLSQSPKPDGAMYSFRPQRPAKKMAPTSAPPALVAVNQTPMDSDPSPLSRDTPAIPFDECPTNLTELVYSRSFMYSHRVHELVEPDSATITKMRAAQVYRHTSPGSTSNASSREFPHTVHRERRGSSGPKSGRSGSFTFGPSNSFPSLNGGSSSSSGLKSRSGSGSGPYLSPPGYRMSEDNSEASSPGRRDTPLRGGSRISIVSGDSNRFHRELQSLLNKLTLEKFESLSQQILKKFDLINDLPLFEECVKILHTKALLEHSFGAMYAELAKLLDKNYAFEVPSDGSATPPITGTSPAPSHSFSGTRLDQIRSDSLPSITGTGDRSISPARPRSDSGGVGKPRSVTMLRKLFLNNCYYVWEEAMTGKLQLLGEEEEAAKARHRVMGNMIFMGELYKQGLMPLKVLKASADGMVTGIRERMQRAEYSAAEPVCIMLHHLVRVVGETLDKDTKVGKKELDIWFESIKEYASHKALPARARFLLRDVIDDRLNEWRPRRRYEGPMKLEHVRELHEADILMNPLFLASERIIAPTSEFDERQRARTSVSPAKRAEDRSNSAQKHQRSGSAPRQGRRGSANIGISQLPLPSIKEPTPYAPTSPSSSSLAVFPKQSAIDFFTDLEPESLEPIVSYLHQANNQSSERRVLFLVELLNWALDRSKQDQTLIPRLLSSLSAQSVLSSLDLVNGLSQMMSSLEDLRLDVPQAPYWLGKWLLDLSSPPLDLLTSAQRTTVLDKCPASCKEKVSQS